MTALRFSTPGALCARCSAWWPALWRIEHPRCPECGDPLTVTMRPRGWVHVRDEGDPR